MGAIQRHFTWQLDTTISVSPASFLLQILYPEIAETLIENGADVNAEDRGGLIPLHNAASYGHVEIAQVLLKHGSHVNANDRWQFTPLHEAAQKGRTQLCALLLSHGADPYVKNQEGQTTIEVATQDDVRCLLR